MRSEIVPFTHDHLRALTATGEARRAVSLVTEPGWERALVAHRARTLLVDGRPVAAAGLLPQWVGRAVAWALIDDVPPQAWTRIVRAMAAAIEREHALGAWRIEATCAREFAPGARLLQMLGFEVEGLMTAYDIGGRDHFLFAHVRGAEKHG